MVCTNCKYERTGKPEVYCSLSLSFNENANMTMISEELSTLGLNIIKEVRPRHQACTIIEISVLRYEQFWNIDQALSTLFSMIHADLQAIREIVEAHDGETYIDIAIVANETYPSILFSKENMMRIHALNAQISIDLL